MSDIIFPSPVRAVDGNGNPVPGARAYFYVSGTSTPATVFADASENVPHPSPLVADAAGVFPPVYKGGQPLRVLVTDADGVTLPGFPIDPVLTAPAGGGAAQTISFDPTPQIPVTNVQAAIEQVQANLVAPLLAGGIGVVGNADVLANLDATNTPSGFYRWTDTATGTLPVGWSGETGIVYLLRETASNALQFIARRDIQQMWWRRLTEGAWSSWRPLARYVTDPTDEGDTAPALWSGADVAAMVDSRGLGSGQTWQDVLSSRSAGVVYQNTTGKPIMVSVRYVSPSTGRAFECSVDGSTWVTIGYAPPSNGEAVSVVIPDGHYYRINGPVSGFSYWAELR